jgi:hypothetical protein
MTDSSELSELRAENARLRAKLAGRSDYAPNDERPRQVMAPLTPVATVDAREFGYPSVSAMVRDQFDRNCRASVGMAEPRNNDHEQDGA